MEALKLPSIEDIYALPEDVRAELIDGQIYYQAAPSSTHQRIVRELTTIINLYIKNKGGDCEVFPAPFAVFPYADETNYVEPDISIICDKNKLNDKGCYGAPDWIIEVLSPNTLTNDLMRKFKLYEKAGVREYWIIDSKAKTVTVYNFEHDTASRHDFETIKAGIYDDLEIDFSSIDI